jgi:chloride channel, nucleotide-sensitive, 1A
MEVISEAPQLNTFVPLLEHQTATPASFYSGPPVLHYHSQRCKIILRSSDMARSAAVQRLGQGGEKLIATNGNSSNRENELAPPAEEETSAQRIISDIDVWVTSESVPRDHVSLSH